MGYTHYISRIIEKTNNAGDFDLFVQGFNKLHKVAVNELGIEIGDGIGATKNPEVTLDRVSFNGVGDMSHETFTWARDTNRGYDFCKTALKPYDALVTASLLLLKEIYGDAVQINSDGSWDNWMPGRQLFQMTFDLTPTFPFVEEKVTA
jgi:hypothetical protein